MREGKEPAGPPRGYTRSSLYVTEQGLILRRDKKHVAEIPLLERLILFGRIHVTTGAISALLRCGIETTFFCWHGRLKGRLVSLESKNIPPRLKQRERAHDEAFALELVRRIVCAKMESSRSVLLRYQRNHPDWNPGEALGELEQALRLVERARSRESLRGLEGQAAAAYFRAYSLMFRRSLGFSSARAILPKIPSMPPSHSDMLSFSGRLWLLSLRSDSIRSATNGQISRRHLSRLLPASTTHDS